jgi:hypothetical protein
MAENGRLPESDLSPTVAGGQLVDEAAASVNRMAGAFYREFGYPMAATDTYRTYAQQVAVREDKGVWAAIPGTSNHGWGLAVDWSSNINRDTSAEHRWMEQNGPKYGWFNPWWAVDDNPANGQYEPWHWEYVESLDRMKGAPFVRFPSPGELGYGSDGPAVREVQELLRDVGYSEIVIDGDYGMGTAVRVQSYQQAHGLTQNAVVGPKLLTMLRTATNEEDDMPTAAEIAKAVWDHRGRVPSNLQKYLGTTATMRAIVTATALRAERGDLTDDQIIAELREIAKGVAE